MQIYLENLSNSDDYIIATYFLKSKTNLHDAAYNIAVGQSIGNPNVRNNWETETLIKNHCAKIVGNKDTLISKKEGNVTIAFPKVNINIEEDGISQLLCFLMGGHLDIDIIESCHLLDVKLNFQFFKPKFGISGIRKLTNVYNKPILGGILKPKTGLCPNKMLEIIKELVENGINFIKEDEILGNPHFCTIEDRIKTFQPYLKDKKVIYCYCINSDYPYCIQRAKRVADAGGNGVHINIWNGLGVYKSIRELDLPLFLHFQKSGDKIFTNTKHNFHISWNVICKLAVMQGVDSVHAGMWGGYSTETELNYTLEILREANVLPSLSCGMHPGIVNKITSLFGNQYMAAVGGSIHGHQGGSASGTRAMRQAIDQTFGEEYKQAIQTWGLHA